MSQDEKMYLKEESSPLGLQFLPPFLYGAGQPRVDGRCLFRYPIHNIFASQLGEVRRDLPDDHRVVLVVPLDLLGTHERKVDERRLEGHQCHGRESDKVTELLVRKVFLHDAQYRLQSDSEFAVLKLKREIISRLRRIFLLIISPCRIRARRRRTFQVSAFPSRPSA